MRSFLFLSLLVFVGCGPGASALRCYSCEDCDENTQLTEMEVCEALPGNSNGPDTPVSSNPVQNAPAPAPAAPEAPAPAQNPSVPASTSVEDGEEDYDSDESSTMGIMPAGGNGNGGATGAGGAAAAGGAGGGGGAGDGGQSQYSEEEEEEDEDEEEDKRRRRRQADLDIPIPVCYTVRLILNETVITKRGCTNARMGNESTACDGLFDNWTVGVCQTCHNDGCNQPISGSSRLIGHSAIVLLAVMSIVGHSLI
ncbi:uncharacterized protein [Drosophila bipectinata]|uniref:uncharacterized protein n=1 Tax=Drosophila bipectinata TaxID=42026 RepID=UPI001C8AA864|nr:protein cramped-like [Drosophila bipectinata]